MNYSRETNNRGSSYELAWWWRASIGVLLHSTCGATPHWYSWLEMRMVMLVIESSKIRMVMVEMMVVVTIVRVVDTHTAGVDRESGNDSAD